MFNDVITCQGDTLQINDILVTSDGDVKITQISKGINVPAGWIEKYQLNPIDPITIIGLDLTTWERVYIIAGSKWQVRIKRDRT